MLHGPKVITLNDFQKIFKSDESDFAKDSPDESIRDGVEDNLEHNNNHCEFVLPKAGLFFWK